MLEDMLKETSKTEKQKEKNGKEHLKKKKTGISNTCIMGLPQEERKNKKKYLSQ